MCFLCGMSSFVRSVLEMPHMMTTGRVQLSIYYDWLTHPSFIHSLSKCHVAANIRPSSAQSIIESEFNRPHSWPDIRSFNVAAIASSCQTKHFPGTKESDGEEKPCHQLCPSARFPSSILDNPPPKEPHFCLISWPAEEEAAWEKSLANFSLDDPGASPTRADLHLAHLSWRLSTPRWPAQDPAPQNSPCLLLHIPQCGNIQCVLLFIPIRIPATSLRHLHGQWGLQSWENGLPDCCLFQHCSNYPQRQWLCGEQATEEDKGNVLLRRALHRKVRKRHILKHFFTLN